MAKLTDPLFSTEAHGAVAGTVYRQHRGAAIACAKTAVHSGHSGPVSDRLRLLNEVSRAWRFTLRPIQIQWHNYARAMSGHPGCGYSPGRTGYQWYLSCNTNLKLIGKIIREIPPDHPMDGSLLYINPHQQGTDIKVFYLYDVKSPKWHYTIQVWLCGPFSNGRNSRIKDAKYSGHSNLDSYITVETTGAAGQWHVFCRLIDDQGLPSNWLHDKLYMNY